jgi:hypothetical protein
LLLREPLADVRSYPDAVSAESLVLDLAVLDLRRYLETPDADSVCNIAVNRQLATWLQARKN